MKAREKVKTLDELRPALAEARRKGRRVVFTNGCFDLLHTGHLRYLEAAGALGDLLVVGVNSDRSVRHIKGPRRPVVGETDRSELVAGLHCVDYVVLFDTPDPLPLIQAISPDVLVKGADWAMEDIVGGDWVRARGGRVERVPLVAGMSTTRLIQSVLEAYGASPEPCGPRASGG